MGHREQLLASAKRCLYEQGYARTSARDIVAASGTNLASIGYHFGSKEALLNTAMMQAFHEWGDELERVMLTDNDADPIEQLASVWSRAIESFSKHRPLWVASVEAFAHAEYSPALREQLAASYEQTRPRLSAVIQKFSDSMDERTARVVGTFHLALLGGLTLQWLIDPKQAPSGREMAEALRHITDVISAAQNNDEETS